MHASFLDIRRNEFDEIWINRFARTVFCDRLPGRVLTVTSNSRRCCVELVVRSDLSILSEFVIDKLEAIGLFHALVHLSEYTPFRFEYWVNSEVGLSKNGDEQPSFVVKGVGVSLRSTHSLCMALEVVLNNFTENT